MGRLIGMRAAVGVRNKVQPVADAIGAVRSVTIPGSSLLLLLSLNIQPLTVCADELLHSIVDIMGSFQAERLQH